MLSAITCRSWFDHERGVDACGRAESTRGSVLALQVARLFTCVPYFPRRKTTALRCSIRTANSGPYLDMFILKK
jgi:hypothetical protein